MLLYAWPGNVRELDHTIERAVLMARSEFVEVSDLGLQSVKTANPGLDDMSLEAVEAVLVRKALERASGNVSHAAEALGLSRGALYRRIEKYGL
jgi:transcriptional regulator of acetoin/glycerol metabolism